MPKYRISIDRERCLADTICTAICHENWFMSEDGKASFREEIIDESKLECNREAARSCPTGIIKLRKID